MPATFTVTTDGPFAHIELTRPEARNALGVGFWANFAEAVRDLDRSGAVRALVISGQGRHFCAGMDMAAFAAGSLTTTDTPAEREAFTHRVADLQATLSALEAARFPVVAAVHGACIGAGLELVAACDLRYAATGAYFRVEEINIGMMADVGSLQRLPRLLPEHVVKQLAYLGRTLDADEAARHGFAVGVGVGGGAEEVLAAATEAARTIARKAPLAVAGSKAAIRYARDHSLADGLAWAALAQGSLWSPADIGAAITARADGGDASFRPLGPLPRWDDNAR